MLILGFLLLTLCWLPPGHYPPWLSFQSEWLASLASLCIGLGVLPRKHLALPNLAILTGAVAIIPLIQVSLSQILFMSDGVLAAAYVLAFSLCMVVGATLAREERGLLLDGLTAAFVTASIVSVGLVLFQWMRLGQSMYVADTAPGARFYANLGQPNHLSTLLALGVVGLLRWYEMRRIGPVGATLGVLWLGWGQVLTQSRTAWVFIALMILWVAFKQARVGLRTPRYAPVIAGLVFAGAVASLNRINQVLLLTSVDLSERLTQGTRLIHWGTLVDAIWRAPWAGYGWGQVTLAQQAAAEDHPLSMEILTNSHNLFLDLLVWNGLPIGLILSLVLIVWFARHVMSCKSLDEWTLLASLAAVAIHALVEYPLSYAYFLLPTGLMMGALDGLDNGRPQPRTLPRIAFASALLVLAALFAWISIEYMRVEEAARQLRFVNAGIGVDRMPTAAPPNVILLDSPEAFHRFAMTEARPGMSIAEVDWMRRVSARYAFAPSMFRFAVVAALNDRADEAAHTLARLCKMNDPARCIEAHETWASLSERYPQMKAVALPPKPHAAAIGPNGP